jgi:hypothetical protein
MPVNCSHLDEIADVQAPESVCPQCVAIGSRWVHLRQCMVCGQTGCCSDSPNSHASKHYDAAGHPVMRSIEPDEDWMWCFVDEETFRPSKGRYIVVDGFLETGLWYAYDAVRSHGAFPTDPNAMTQDGFPFGEWVEVYRSRRDQLDPEQVEALEGLPGWTWQPPGS